MIRVPVQSRHGMFKTMRTRVPRTRTFAVYREASQQFPGLITGLYNAISRTALARPGTDSISSAELLKQLTLDGPLERSWAKVSDRASQETRSSSRFSGLSLRPGRSMGDNLA